MYKENLKDYFLIIFAFFFCFMFSYHCPIYYFLGIPCPGCGITRAFIMLIKGDIIMSLKYNPTLFISIVIIFEELLSKLIIGKFPLYEFTNNHKKATILIAILLFIIILFHNINNPLLYEGKTFWRR